MVYNFLAPLPDSKSTIPRTNNNAQVFSTRRPEIRGHTIGETCRIKKAPGEGA